MLQVHRREIESHLQSAMRLHLHLTCAKLNNMQGEFKETTRKLEEKYEKNTRRLEEKFGESKRELEKQKEVTRKLEEKVGETKRELEKQNEVTRKLEEKFGETKRELEQKYEEVTRKLEHKVNVLENRLMQIPEEYTWKISRFSKVQRQAKSGEKTSIYSPPFYYFGYKFRLWLFPNGKNRGKDTHLSLYFHLLKGEYDARLPWPFQKIMKFTLIDQQEDAGDRKNIVMSLTGIPSDKEVVERPLTSENRGWGFTEFVSLTKLIERRYIADDTIVIQVQVAPE